MTRRRAAALAAAALLLAPASAGAHTGIDGRSPGPGAAVPRDRERVKVVFASRVSDAKLTVARGATKASVGQGTVRRGGRLVRTRLRRGLGAGRYRVTVRWLSRDGHVQSVSWSFRLR